MKKKEKEIEAAEVEVKNKEIMFDDNAFENEILLLIIIIIRKNF